ncbi:MAG: hypothetical protein ABIH48_02945, partial [Candidatus Falkowbacteria bacterium]
MAFDLSEFVTNNPAVPILSGSGIGAMFPLLLSKKNRKYWFLKSLLGAIAGGGAGAMGAYALSDPTKLKKEACMTNALNGLLLA